jgi:hypothetical protein
LKDRRTDIYKLEKVNKKNPPLWKKVDFKIKI